MVMSRRGMKRRPAWEDRFVIPSVADLLGVFPKHQSALIEQWRQSLLGMDGVHESIVFQGTWRWTLAYSAEPEERPWAYLVPKPGSPLVAVPLPPEVVSALPARKLSRTVRDGITYAPRVGEVAWPQWELTSRTLLDELLIVARKRREMMLSPTA